MRVSKLTEVSMLCCRKILGVIHLGKTDAPVILPKKLPSGNLKRLWGEIFLPRVAACEGFARQLVFEHTGKGFGLGDPLGHFYLGWYTACFAFLGVHFF